MSASSNDWSADNAMPARGGLDAGDNDDPHPQPHRSRTPRRRRASPPVVRMLMKCCACTRLVNADPSVGGYCCTKCYWVITNPGRKGHKDHGYLCSKLYASPDAKVAPAVPPRYLAPSTSASIIDSAAFEEAIRRFDWDTGMQRLHHRLALSVRNEDQLMRQQQHAGARPQDWSADNAVPACGGLDAGDNDAGDNAGDNNHGDDDGGDNDAGGDNHGFAVLVESELSKMHAIMADWLYRIKDGACNAYTQRLVDNIQSVQYDVEFAQIRASASLDTREDVDFEFAQIVGKFDELRTSVQTFLGPHVNA